MTKDDIRDCFLEELVKVAPDIDPETVQPDAHLQDDLGLDSMDILNLVTALHARLGIDIPEKSYPEIATPARAVDWLARVEIDPARIDDRPTTFSGGMRQRLQIARNLVTHPRLVLMDEPTSGLDVSVQARLLDLIRGLVAELGLAVIIVTHDLAVARLLSHRIMVMRHGRVIETGLTDQVLDDPREPYTQLLVSSVLAA
jgi:putative phosphonate transport system ATP-binding protein